MTIINNAAPDVTNISASSIAPGGTSTGDVHDSVADADDDISCFSCYRIKNWIWGI